jgi:Mg/Co/Ni transporter MgtE
MLDAVTKGYLALHPAAAARTLSRLDARDVEAIFRAMPHPLAAQVLQHMAPTSASQCLQQLPPANASEILARTPLLPAVSALRLMGKSQAKELFGLMPRSTAARLRLRLRLAEDVIGAFVDDDILTLAPENRVGDALRFLRRSARHTGQKIAVLDERRHLLGTVDLSDILRNPDRRLIQHLVQPARNVLNARAALQTVTNHPAWQINDSLPVINRNGVFQGVLRRSRVIKEETRLLNHVADHGQMTSTRAALADIFWLAVSALFVGAGNRSGRERADS